VLRLVYLSVTNMFALLRLFTASNQDKEIEILAMRHQITVLQRQLGRTRPRFSPGDRVFLAALLNRLPRDVLGRIRLVVQPATVLHWHRALLARRHGARSLPRRPGRPRTVRSIRVLVLRLARENPGWGYRRIHGELLTLGIKVAASTVWEILRKAGIKPAPERISTTWASFLRSQAGALLACDFFETSTVIGARLFVLAVIEQPPGAWADRKVLRISFERPDDAVLHAYAERVIERVIQRGLKPEGMPLLKEAVPAGQRRSSGHVRRSRHVERHAAREDGTRTGQDRRRG
jgi:transposase